MLVDGADAAEIAAAGHGNLCPAETAQQSADEIVARSFREKLIRGPGGVDMAAVDLHRVAVDGADGRAKLLQNLQNRGNVGDLGMFSMRQTPSTRMAAGIMATAAFFAPLISTSPNRGLPPCTMYFVNVLTSFQVFFCGEKALRRD